MNDPASAPSTRQQNPVAKLLVELGPLIVFYGVYFKGDAFFPIPEGEAIFYATGAFMAAFALSFAYSIIRNRSVSPMLLITGAIVAIFGGLTIILKNQTFIYMKPTIVNLTFAAILVGGLTARRLFLKSLLDHAFHLPADAWRTLTFRFVGFFIALAALNELVWRNFSEAFWVNFKTFGVMPLTLLFTFAQLPFILKRQSDSRTGAQKSEPEQADPRGEQSSAGVTSDASTSEKADALRTTRER